MGLVQREIEAAGFSTISISNVWELTASVGVPRVAAVEHPFSALMGLPGDQARQGDVLRLALRALAEASEPGSVVHLPFRWPVDDDLDRYQPPEPPPITQYLKRHITQIPQLIRREIP
ncbi:MAG: hypothetical protein JXB85_14610 [Anaerolineales bacterium]|nr:hypothetical protein [Anaerolineales bacterium]